MEVAKNVQDAIHAGVARAEALDTKNDLSPRCNTSAMANLADEGEEETDLNYGTSEGARKAAITRRSNGGFKGDTKELKIRRKQSNPYQPPADAPDKIHERAMVKSIKKTKKTGGRIETTYEKEGLGKIIIRGGTPGVKKNESVGGSGTKHIAQKHPKDTPESIAKTVIKGSVDTHPTKNTRRIIESNGSKLVFEKELKAGSGRSNKDKSKLHTGFKEKQK